MRTDIQRTERGAGFRHDVLLYAGVDGFVDRTSAFIEDAVAAGEPILVVVNGERIERLRRRLGGDPPGVRFADMEQVGRNPARIIPAWREFVAQQTSEGGRFRGLGEPIWETRTEVELIECARHEALLNLAFADAPAWWLACPYDTASLSPSVLEEAERNHPGVLDDGRSRVSETYRGLGDVSRPFDLPLAEPGGPWRELRFGLEAESLAAARTRVGEAAVAFGLDAARTGDLVLVVNEVVTNSVRHGGGAGLLRIWEEDASLVCEVSDGGRIVDPLVGRGKPPADRGSGFGLWLANQLCDLVQIRSFDSGSVVRLHVRR